MTTTLAPLNIEDLACDAESIPALPQTTSQLLTTLADPMFEMRQIVQIVKLDQPLTVKILKIANSAAYSAGRQYESVDQAVVRVGSGTIMALAFSAAARPPADVDLSAFGISLQQYWNHSVGAVAAAEEMMSRRIARFGPSFSTTALLHDYGKVLLAAHMTSDRLDAIKEFHETHPGQGPIDAERAIVGIDHAAAGALVARHWRLPETLVRAIEGHHDSVDWDDDLTNGVIIANRVACDLAERQNLSLDAFQQRADAMLALGVSDADYDDIVQATRERFGTLQELFQS